MQLFVNNWSAALTASAAASAASLSVDPAQAANLVGLGTGDHYVLTLAEISAAGEELRREIVRCTAAAGGSLTVTRAQEGTVAQVWDVGTAIEARLTKGSMEALQQQAGATPSDAAPLPLGAAAAPGTSGELSRGDHMHPRPAPADIGAATAAQGVKADTAVQPGSLAPVATSGAYADLAGRPAIPSTAAEVGAIPASEKGAANGVATLGADSKIQLAQLPATAITSTFVVNTEAAMLALSAQEGDVAVRPDISTSFILRVEPASTLANWQELLSPAAGGGAPVGSSTPQPLGTASPGVSTSASRQDHVHAMPSAADVGAAPSSHVGAGGGAHADVVSGGASGFMTGAQASKLEGVAPGATANQTDTFLLSRANHTGSQATSTITGLDAALAAKLSNPMTTAGDLIAGGASGDPQRLAAGTNGKVLKMVSGAPAWADEAGGVNTQSILIACSDEATALTAGAGKVTFRMPYGFTLSAVRASLTTAQASGSVLTVDINEGGTSILSTKLTIDNAEKTSVTAATAAVISDAALANDAEITIDIDQVGDGTAKGLKVALIGVPA